MNILKVHSFYIGIKGDEFCKISGLDKPVKNGNEKIIEHSMPFVKVKNHITMGNNIQNSIPGFLLLIHCTIIQQHF